MTAAAGVFFMKRRAFTFIKEYESTDDATFPTETLEFEVTANSNNPDGGTALITIGTDNKFDIAGEKTTDIVVNYPSYPKVGVYRYTIKEKEGSSQGVTYDIKKEIKVTLQTETGKYVNSDIEVSGGSDAGNAQTITADDRILALSTCSSDFTDARVIVLTKMIPR